MHEGKRPGGLTWLAVFNFIGSAMDLLGVVTLLAMVAFAPHLKELMKEGAEQQGRSLNEDEKRSIAIFDAFEETGFGKLVLYSALEVSCATLLLVAGIGYLKQRRWGRRLGLIYAAVSVATTLISIYTLPGAAGGGFRFAALIAFIYPLLTVILLNTTFREDFVR